MLALMSLLSSRIRTGDPSLDALLTAALIGLWPSLVTACQKIVARWRQREQHEPTRNTIVVRRHLPEFGVDTGYGGGEARANELWFDVMDALRRQETTEEARSLDASSVNGSETTLVPVATEQKFEFMGEVVSWSVECTAADKNGKVLRGHERNEKLVLVADSQPVLVDFVKRARLDAVKRMAAKPELYRYKSTGWHRSAMGTTRTFDNLVLDAKVGELLRNDLEQFMRSKDWYADMGLDWKRGYLLHGPPGTGKTSVIRAISHRLDASVYSLNLADIANDNCLDVAFDRLPKGVPYVLVLEDVDATRYVTQARSATHARATRAKAKAKDGDEAGGGARDEPWGITLAALLNHLDGIGGSHGRVVVMTSNHPEVLDPALTRPGRVDLKVHLGLCTAEMLARIADKFYPGRAPKTSLPPDVFSPASVSSAYMTHRADPDAAHAYLLGLL